MEDERYLKVKEAAEIFYKNIKEIRCPYFNGSVAFNSKGLDHIKMKGWNKARLKEDQYMRLKLLKYAPEILKKSHTLQEYNEKRGMERQNINSRWETRAVVVKHYGFVSIIDDIRIKIVVKEIVGGNKYFWSIIPFWKMHRCQSGVNKKILCEGDLECD